MAEDLQIITSTNKEEQYRSLIPQIEALLYGETDLIANLANISAALKEQFKWFWVGFYLVKNNELVLGPFQGRPACIRIKFGEGVCGAVAATLRPQRVDDVHAFPGHIACDAASASELVVPIVRDGELIAVLDLDSPEVARFDAEDETGCLKLAEILARAL